MIIKHLIFISSLLAIAGMCAVAMQKQQHSTVQTDAQMTREELAQRTAQLYSRYGLQIHLHDGVANSNRGEIVSLNETEVNNFRFIEVAIMGQESRRKLTPKEELAFGRSVGVIECYNKTTDEWFNSTAFVVAKSVIYSADHSLYQKTAKGNIYERTFDPIGNCDFNLKNPSTGKTYKRINFKSIEGCPPAGTKKYTFSTCDFSIIKLKENVPDDVPPLELLSATDKELAGQKVIAVGFHWGVNIEKAKIKSSVKLIDVGEIMPKGPNSKLLGLTDKFAYTADTNEKSSGQPVLISIGERFFVVGSHSGDSTAVASTVGAKFNEKNHFNFASTINPVVFEILTRRSPAESSRFSASKSRRISQMRLRK